MSDWMNFSDNLHLGFIDSPHTSSQSPGASGDGVLPVTGEEKYFALSRAVGNVTYEYCLARGETRWSDRCEEVFGVKAQELQSEPALWLSRIHEEDRERVCSEYRKALLEGATFDLEYRVRHPMGHHLWVRDRGVPVEGPDGRTRGIVGFLKDISSHRQRDEDLLSAKRALESSLNGIMLADTQGCLTYANSSFLKLFHYEEPDQVVGKPAAEFWENPRKAQAVFRLLRNSGEWSGQVAARRRDGSRLVVELSAHTVFDQNGSPIGYMASFIDITDHREAERERQESEKKYRLLFSSSSDALIICNAVNGRILEVNPAALNQYGYGYDEFFQMDIFNLAEEPEESVLRLKKIQKCGQANFSLLRHRRRDGSCFEAEVSAATFKWKNCLLMACFIRDVSDRQRLERLKDDVLSAVSHEMRTPLTAILGYTEFMLNHDLDPGAGLQYLDIIRQQSERLRELIENHLNLQQLRAGFGIGLVRPVEVKPLLHSVIGGFRNSSEKHRILVECAADLSPVQADERQLHRALQNLLSNAIKYSPDGGDVILGAFQDGRNVTLYVRDEGIGIPHHAQDKIFDRYFRLCPAEGPTIGGTGLGLALVKEIVKACSGHLRVESSPGQGSTFYISLPTE
ncbi:MAG: PAS domain S-box protein [Syntrophotaleaceae bacterium]